MIENFPSEIIGENIKLVKLEPSVENLEMLYEILDNNREELRPWLEWIEFVKKPEDPGALCDALHPAEEDLREPGVFPPGGS